MKKIDCNDSHCPKHGGLKIRGLKLVGKITSNRMRRSASFELERRHYIPKFQRYEVRRTKLIVHLPDCIQVKAGDEVTISECRPLSKTKSFVIVEKVSK